MHLQSQLNSNFHERRYWGWQNSRWGGSTRKTTLERLHELAIYFCAFFHRAWASWYRTVISLMSEVTHQVKHPTSMHIQLRGFKSVLLFVKRVQMKKHAMHIYTIIMHISTRSRDEGLIWIYAGWIEGKKTQSKNPLGGKKAHGKNPQWRACGTTILSPKNRHTGAVENARSVEAYSTFYNYLRWLCVTLKWTHRGQIT